MMLFGGTMKNLVEVVQELGMLNFSIHCTPGIRPVMSPL